MKIVRLLSLHDNNLSGVLPGVLRKITELYEMTFDDKNLLSGPIPTSFKALDELSQLSFQDTAICEPSDKEFQKREIKNLVFWSWD